jgi:divalent metal cation (Fe/Co/Zn/Cd) transporter
LLALFAGASFQSAADWAALLASFFMLYNAFHIGYPAIRELLDEAVDSETESKIGELLKNEKNIKNINACIVRKSGFDRIVELHIQVDGARTVRE